MPKSKKAFTLIELLVVIAIIGILATLAVISLSNARTKARDAKRVADVKQIQTALELYFNDNDRFPTAAEFNSGSITSQTDNGAVTYMLNVPEAPNPPDGSCSTSTNAFTYSVNTEGTSYTLSYCIGNRTGDLSSGDKCLTRDGMLDTSCTCAPNCTGLCSGDDGCGGTCPDNCTGGQVCTSGTCQTPFSCDSQVTVSAIGGHVCNDDYPDYDQCIYDIVQIGEQCWLTQNMNIGSIVAGNSNQFDTGSLEKYCYNNDYLRCMTDGGLYQWDEAMQYSVSEGAQGVCPNGWHIPTDTEQNTLDQYLNDTTCNADRIGAWDCANAGIKLKPVSLGGTSGFEGLLAGTRYTNGSFTDRGTSAYFWSSTISGSDAWYRYLYTGLATVYRTYYDRTLGFSVRCLQD
jgi:uncharacterized protein (TIGR02145 family)/prepilin-type N-terminal cleavage/methylation domain-containing protein